MYRRHNKSQQPKTFAKIKSENPAYNLQFVYDETTDDDAWYDELTDLDGANETYDHPHAVPRCVTPHPYEGLNATNTTYMYDQPDVGPALPDRPMPNQYGNVNQETTKPTTTPAYLELVHVDDEQNQLAVHVEPTTTPAYLELVHVDDKQNQKAAYQEPTATHAYLELIDVDEEKNQTAVHLEPTTTPAYLELIQVDEDKNETAEC